MADRRMMRSRWAAVGAAIAVSLGGGGLFLANAAPSEPSSVVTIDPVRILDTRDPVNLGLRGPFVSAVSQKLQVVGAAVPAGATGVLMNVTVVSPSAAGFLSVRPGDATGAPSTSSLNFVANAIVPNAVQVALPTTGPNAGQIDITYDAFGVAGPTTDVLVDVVGYLVVGGSGTGPAGPTGPTGPVGPAGPVNLRWAKVGVLADDAILRAGAGAVDAQYVGPGEYGVTFNSSIVGCGWTATYNDNDAGDPFPYHVTVERRDQNDPNDLVVRIWNADGNAMSPGVGDNDGFTVMAICP